MDENIFNQINHRFVLLKDLDADLISRQRRGEDNISQQDKIMTMEILRLGKELDETKELADTLNKTIHHLGGLLKNKIQKRDVEQLSRNIDSWKLEEFITKKELDKLFNHYSQLQ